MKRYIGTKIIQAFQESKGPMPGGEEGYAVVYEDGYRSWSPKAVFEAAYRETAGLTFGLAVEALKLGKKVARTGWNGSGMWVTIAGPIAGTSISHDKFWSPNNAQFAYNQPNSEAVVRPYFTINTANDEIASWAPSVGDCLADDWQIV